jgi:hypothetical protein
MLLFEHRKIKEIAPIFLHGIYYVREKHKVLAFECQATFQVPTGCGRASLLD